MGYLEKVPDSKSRHKNINITGTNGHFDLKFICVTLIFVGSIELLLSRGTLTQDDPLNKFEYNDRPTQRMIDLFRKQAPERRFELKRILFQKVHTLADFYEVLAPEIFCTELMRIGHVNDAGKWICSPHNIPAYCTILSLGLNNQITFDRQLQALINRGCRVIGYDKTEQREKTKMQMLSINGSANLGYIDAKDGPDNHITLETIVRKHNITDIEIFKMDIEGAELVTLIDFLDKNLIPLPPQILIELHTSNAAWQFIDLLASLSKKGYLLASFEILASHHRLCEFSFIHETALARYNAHILAKYMDVEQ